MEPLPRHGGSAPTPLMHQLRETLRAVEQVSFPSHRPIGPAPRALSCVPGTIFSKRPIAVSSSQQGEGTAGGRRCRTPTTALPNVASAQRPQLPSRGRGSETGIDSAAPAAFPLPTTRWGGRDVFGRASTKNGRPQTSSDAVAFGAPADAAAVVSDVVAAIRAAREDAAAAVVLEAQANREARTAASLQAMPFRTARSEETASVARLRAGRLEMHASHARSRNGGGLGGGSSGDPSVFGEARQASPQSPRPPVDAALETASVFSAASASASATSASLALSLSATLANGPGGRFAAVVTAAMSSAAAPDASRPEATAAPTPRSLCASADARPLQGWAPSPGPSPREAAARTPEKASPPRAPAVVAAPRVTAGTAALAASVQQPGVSAATAAAAAALSKRHVGRLERAATVAAFARFAGEAPLSELPLLRGVVGEIDDDDADTNGGRSGEDGDCGPQPPPPLPPGLRSPLAPLLTLPWHGQPPPGSDSADASAENNDGNAHSGEEHAVVMASDAAPAEPPLPNGPPDSGVLTVVAGGDGEAVAAAAAAKSAAFDVRRRPAATIAYDRAVRLPRRAADAAAARADATERENAAAVEWRRRQDDKQQLRLQHEALRRRRANSALRLAPAAPAAAVATPVAAAVEPPPSLLPAVRPNSAQSVGVESDRESTSTAALAPGSILAGGGVPLAGILAASLSNSKKAVVAGFIAADVSKSRNLWRLVHGKLVSREVPASPKRATPKHSLGGSSNGVGSSLDELVDTRGSFESNALPPEAPPPVPVAAPVAADTGIAELALALREVRLPPRVRVAELRWAVSAAEAGGDGPTSLGSPAHSNSSFSPSNSSPRLVTPLHSDGPFAMMRAIAAAASAAASSPAGTVGGFHLPSRLVRFNTKIASRMSLRVATFDSNAGGTGGTRPPQVRRRSSIRDLVAPRNGDSSSLEGTSEGTAAGLFPWASLPALMSAHKFVLEYTLRPDVRRLTVEHVVALVAPFDAYITQIDFSTRGGHFVALSCEAELQGLKAIARLLAAVERGDSALLKTASVAPSAKLGVEGACMLESPRVCDFEPEEFFPPPPPRKPAASVRRRERKRSQRKERAAAAQEQALLPTPERGQQGQQESASSLLLMPLEGDDTGAPVTPLTRIGRGRAGTRMHLLDATAGVLAEALEAGSRERGVVDGDEEEDAGAANASWTLPLTPPPFQSELNQPSLHQQPALHRQTGASRTASPPTVCFATPRSIVSPGQQSLVLPSPGSRPLAVSGIAGTTKETHSRRGGKAHRGASAASALNQSHSLMVTSTLGGSVVGGAAAASIVVDPEQQRLEDERAALGEYVGARARSERLALVVVVSSFDSSLIEPLGNAEEDGQVLMETLKKFGYVVVPMLSAAHGTPAATAVPPSTTVSAAAATAPTFLRPTAPNVRRMLNAFASVVPNASSVLALFVLSRGYCGPVAGLEGQWEVALCQDSNPSNLTSKAVLIPAQLGTLKDAAGKQPLIFVDTWPMPLVPLIKTPTAAVSFSWLTSNVEEGGNEMLATYPAGAGGVCTYYLLRALEGRVYSPAASGTDISINALIWWIHPRLQRRGCKVQHNATLARANSVFFPTFQLRAARVTVDAIAQGIAVAREKEANTDVRINMRLLVRRGADGKSASFEAEPARWGHTFMRQLCRTLYHGRAGGKRLFFSSEKRRKSVGRRGAGADGTTLRLASLLESKSAVVAEYRALSDVMVEPEKRRFFDTDFTKMIGLCAAVAASAPVPANRKTLRDAVLALKKVPGDGRTPSPSPVALTSVTSPASGPLESASATGLRSPMPALALPIGPPLSPSPTSLAFPKVAPMTAQRRITAGAAAVPSTACSFDACLTSGFVWFHIPTVQRTRQHAFATKRIAAAMLMQTPPGEQPVAFFRKPTRLHHVVDISFYGTARDVRKLKRLQRTQALQPLAIIHSVEVDPFDVSEHLVMEKLQALMRGHIVRFVLRAQRAVLTEEAQARVEEEAAERQASTEMYRGAGEVLSFATQRWENWGRRLVEDDEGASFEYLTGIAVRFTDHVERLWRRDLQVAEGIEFFPLQDYFYRLSMHGANLRALAALHKVHYFLTGVMWDYFYLQLAYYQGCLRLRNSLRTLCASHGVRFRMPLVSAPTQPPSTDMSRGHSVIRQLTLRPARALAGGPLSPTQTTLRPTSPIGLMHDDASGMFPHFRGGFDELLEFVRSPLSTGFM